MSRSHIRRLSVKLGTILIMQVASLWIRNYDHVQGVNDKRNDLRGRLPFQGRN